MQSASAPYFRLDDPEAIASFLHDRGWLPPDEPVGRTTRAGEGNMNFVARVQTPVRSVILKQSRPWVEKYPDIAAPQDRIHAEVAFYRAAEQHGALRNGMPRLLHFDPEYRAALFEDLGDVRDFSDLYDNPLPPAADLHTLLVWLSALHAAGFAPDTRAELANRAMRALNHAHIFDLPLQPDNGLDLDALTPGLQADAERLKHNARYVDTVHALGRDYLADGQTLVHGDFYPGSWVRTPDGPRVIDPEFGFFGTPSFDVGVFFAHLLMAGFRPEQRTTLFHAYEPPADFDRRRAVQYAGVEIMRRLIGVAQLPMTRTPDEKRDLLAQSEALVLAPEASDLF